MPVVAVQEAIVRPLIPAGEHDLVLASVEAKRIKSTFSKEPDGALDKFIWTFKSKMKDEEGKPYEYAVFTNTKYGNEKAGLTLLLNQLVPDITVETAKDLDTDDLVGQRFTALIRHSPNPTDPSKKYANHVYIIPYVPKSKRPAPPVEDDGDTTDPFEGE